MLVPELAASLVLLFQLDSLAPSRAADHVVQLEVVEGRGSAGDRSIVYRSGNLIRSDSTQYGRSTWNTYTDLARGLVVSSARDSNGDLERVGIDRALALPRRLPPTGRRDRALGESCTVWRLTQENRDTGTEICETDDGILLWEAFWYPRPTDRTVMYRRATAVERRAVRPAELLPPRDLLALALTPPPATPAAATEPDYEVEMAGEDPAEGHYVLRRHGRFFSNVRQASGERVQYVGNGAVTVEFREDEAARPLSLSIQRAGSGPFDRIIARWERVPGRRPERLLGETCTWQENVAIQSMDWDHECRTADGITLKTESWSHWTQRTRRFTARRVSRRPLSETDFAPPARALDWAHWGLTPVP
jgi:hypothetical protein